MIKVLEIIMPIMIMILIGMIARKNNTISQEANDGLQKFVMNYCLPCVLFNSCLSAQFSWDSIVSMSLVFILLLTSSIVSFQLRKKQFPYHNFPLLFSAQETGMLGIPLFMTLFSSAYAYRIGVLDVAQAFVAIPVIAILQADTTSNPSIISIIKKVFTSPLLLMSMLGLVLNLSGIINILNNVGIGSILTSVTSFIGQPVNAVILFCVGYNFKLEPSNIKQVLKICCLHFVVFAIFCIIIQLVLCFVANVDMQTRWAVLLYCALPGSFLTTGLSKTNEESKISASVCSILTVLCLIIFCMMAIIAI